MVDQEPPLSFKSVKILVGIIHGKGSIWEGDPLWGQQPASWSLVWWRKPVECCRHNLSLVNKSIIVKVTLSESTGKVMSSKLPVKVISLKSPHQSFFVKVILIWETQTQHTETQNLPCLLQKQETTRKQHSWKGPLCETQNTSPTFSLMTFLVSKSLGIVPTTGGAQ